MLMSNMHQRTSMSFKPCTDKWFCFLQKHFTDAASGLMTAQLDKMVSQAVDSLSIGGSSGKHFSRPFLMLLHSPKFKTVMLLGCITYTFLLSALCATLLSSHVTGDTFHFEAVSSHRRDMDFSPWNVTSAGVMKDSCVLHATEERIGETSMTLVFPREVSVNGWFFSAEQPASSGEADALRFTMAVSSRAGGKSRKAVGQPTWWMCGRSSSEWTASELADEHEEDEDVFQEFHFLPRVEWIVGCVLEFSILALGSLVAWFLARRGQLRSAWNVLSLSLSLLLLVSSLFALILSADGSWELGLRWWRNVVLTALILPCVTLSTAEMLLIPTLCSAGLLYEALLIADYVLVRQCGASIWMTHEVSSRNPTRECTLSGPCVPSIVSLVSACGYRCSDLRWPRLLVTSSVYVQVLSACAYAIPRTDMVHTWDAQHRYTKRTLPCCPDLTYHVWWQLYVGVLLIALGARLEFRRSASIYASIASSLLILPLFMLTMLLFMLTTLSVLSPFMVTWTPLLLTHAPSVLALHFWR